VLLLGRAYVLEEIGNHDKAIADYNDAIQVDPNEFVAFANRATAWGNKGEYEKAIQDVNRSLQLAPQNPVLYLKRGNFWLAQGDIIKASADFKDALRLNPKSSDPHINLGEIHVSQGTRPLPISTRRFDSILRIAFRLPVAPSHGQLKANRQIPFLTSPRLSVSIRGMRRRFCNLQFAIWRTGSLKDGHSNPNYR
jgi:tetratricopeptide (TPR) repeat protein